MHLIKTRLGAMTPSQGRKTKESPLGHPPLALAALSISDVALVGPRSYRMLTALPNIGV